MRTLFLIAVCSLLVACSVPREIDFSTYEGADVAVLVGEVPACVPRRHFTPWDANTFSALKNPDGSRRPVTPPRLELTAFLPGLVGYTNQEFQAYALSRYDRRASPATWVRIELVDAAAARFQVELADARRSDFTVDGGVGAHGFAVRRRDPGCVGKRAGAGGTIAIEVGPECLADELRTRRVGPQEIEFYCAVSRCFARPALAEGLNYTFDIHQSQFANWLDISKRVRTSVTAWAMAGQGVASTKSYPTIGKSCSGSSKAVSVMDTDRAHA
jgi:hypothetical protein